MTSEQKEKIENEKIKNWVENSQITAITRSTKEEENRCLFLFLNEIHSQSLTLGQEKDKPQKLRGSLQFTFIFYLALFSKNVEFI